MSAVQNALDGLSGYWDNLTDRERKLLGGLGAVLGALAILLPVYLLSASISDLEEDNAEISTALRNIAGSRGRLAAQQSTRLAAEQRYRRRAPSLGSFLEAKAGELDGISVSDVQHEPEREEGNFRIRHTRARFQGTGLRNAILLLEHIKNAQYPVAVERIHVDHNQSGDRYNFQIGVLAYDRQGGGPDGGVPAPAAPTTPSGRSGRAGPPAP
ncbi:MAG: hypothetical protein AB8I08_04560 [Sandaracinaceae bacterium]